MAPRTRLRVLTCDARITRRGVLRLATPHRLCDYGRRLPLQPVIAIRLAGSTASRLDAGPPPPASRNLGESHRGTPHSVPFGRWGRRGGRRGPRGGWPR